MWDSSSRQQTEETVPCDKAETSRGGNIRSMITSLAFGPILKLSVPVHFFVVLSFLAFLFCVTEYRSLLFRTESYCC